MTERTAAPPRGLAGLFVSACVWALARLSPRGRARLAGLIGGLAYALGIRRAVALDNLAHAFPEKAEAERKAIAKKAYANMALTAIEGLSSSSPLFQKPTLTTENWEPLAEAITAGRGALVATAHFGCWELLGELMAQRGVPLSAVVRPLKGALNRELVENRKRAGMRLILQRGALGGMVDAIRSGQVVAQLIDQALPSGKGVFVPFFGRLASTSPAVALVARKTGAPVFVGMAVREGDQIRVEIDGPIARPQTGDSKRDTEAHMAALTELIERRIRKNPEQWFWLHRRWKVAPPRG